MGATKFVGISFAGVVLSGFALGMASSAYADDNCDPLMLQMTPQPVAACGEAPPPPEAVIAPINDVAAPPEGPLPAEVPPPLEPGPFGEVAPPAPALLPDQPVG